MNKKRSHPKHKVGDQALHNAWRMAERGGYIQAPPQSPIAIAIADGGAPIAIGYIDHMAYMFEFECFSYVGLIQRYSYRRLIEVMVMD